MGFISTPLSKMAKPISQGPNSLFIRILLDKKHALPYKVVDALVFHFIRLSNTYKAKLGHAEKLPVLWHQSLLVFCQRFVVYVYIQGPYSPIVSLTDTLPTLPPIRRTPSSMSCVPTRIHRLAQKFAESW